MANQYMHFRKIPSHLREDMRKFFNFMSESDTRRNELLSERIILNQLSPELRFAVGCSSLEMTRRLLGLLMLLSDVIDYV